MKKEDNAEDNKESRNLAKISKDFQVCTSNSSQGPSSKISKLTSKNGKLSKELKKLGPIEEVSRKWLAGEEASPLVK